MIWRRHELIDHPLLQCATLEQQYLGLFHLLKLFQAWFCFEPDVETHDPFGFRCIPRTNDFSDFTLYFLKKVSNPIVELPFSSSLAADAPPEPRPS